MTTNTTNDSKNDRATAASAVHNALQTIDLSGMMDCDVSDVLERPVTRAQIAASNDADGCNVLMALVMSIGESIKVSPASQDGFNRTYGVYVSSFDAQDAASAYEGKNGKAFYYRSGRSVDVITVAGSNGKTPRATNVAKRLTATRLSLALSYLQVLAGAAASLQSKADKAGDKRTAKRARAAGKAIRTAQANAKAQANA